MHGLPRYRKSISDHHIQQTMNFRIEYHKTMDENVHSSSDRHMLVEKLVILHEGLSRDLHWDSLGRIMKP
jgi:hypothetical protein